LDPEPRHEILAPETPTASRWLAGKVEELDHLLERLEIGLGSAALTALHAERTHECA
jgi:hypothetical protein